MTDADNREDIAKHGRRKSDDPEFKTFVSPTHSNRWSSVFNGIGLAFLLGIAVTAGGFLRQVDSNVDDIADNKQSIKEILVQNNTLLVTLAEFNAQQKASDKRFEEKFDESNKKLDKSNEKLDDVIEGVRDNKIQIFNLNQKVSVVDKTSVYLAMR